MKESSGLTPILCHPSKFKSEKKDKNNESIDIMNFNFYYKHTNNIVIRMNPERQFVRLATIQKDSIQLDHEGLERLQQFDFVSIVTMEGTINGMPAIINSGSGFDRGSLANSKEDCIWMSKYPMYSSRLRKYIVLLKIESDQQRKLSIAHAFCCLMSNVVIVCNYQNMNLRYLADPSRLIRQQSGDIKSKMAGLIGFTQNGQGAYPSENTDKFTRVLESQSMTRQLLMPIYSYIGGYQVPPGSQLDGMSFILPYLQDVIEHGAGNSSLIVYGEVMKQYAINLTKQFRSQQAMSPHLAEQLIQVDNNFEDYINAVDTYNSRCKNMLGNQPHNDINSKLKQVRNQAEQSQLFNTNPYYAKKLGTHMDRKQIQLTRLNEQFQDSYNINLLQKQSEKALNNVVGNNKVSHQMIEDQIAKITTKYRNKAQGNNKDKLFNQFMQVFVPTIYADSGINNKVDRQIQVTREDNKKLQKKYQQLINKKSSSKCCEIM